MLKTLLALFLLSTAAQAATPPPAVKFTGDSAAVTTFKMDFGAASGTHSGTTATLTSIPNSLLANSSVTVNGTTCTLGSSCSPAASVTLSVATKTTTYTLTNSDDVILCNGTFTITTQSAASATKKMYYIKNIGTGTCTISAADNIDGSGTLVISQQYAGVQIFPDGSTWWGF